MARNPDAYASFAAFVGARQHALLRSAYLVTGDRYLAEDLVQTALAKLALRWERICEGEPEAYVRTIITRDAISWWRRHRRERLVEAPEPTTADRGPEDRMVLEAALARLTPKQRAVLVLRYFDDLSEREAAEVLRVSVGTVKSQTHAALGRIRTLAPELAEFAGSPGATASPEGTT